MSKDKPTVFGEKALEYGNRIAPKPPPPSRLPNNGQGSGKKIEQNRQQNKEKCIGRRETPTNG